MTEPDPQTPRRRETTAVDPRLSEEMLRVIASQSATSDDDKDEHDLDG